MPTVFTRYPFWRRWFGSRSEREAAKYLRREGFRILAANVRDCRGELDLLAMDGPVLVVVEVRYSESADFRRLGESINAEKQRRITEATLRFLQRRRIRNVPVRFDVVLIVWPGSEVSPKIHHIRNAFPATGRFQMHS